MKLNLWICPSGTSVWYHNVLHNQSLLHLLFCLHKFYIGFYFYKFLRSISYCTFKNYKQMPASSTYIILVTNLKYTETYIFCLSLESDIQMSFGSRYLHLCAHLMEVMICSVIMKVWGTVYGFNLMIAKFGDF